MALGVSPEIHTPDRLRAVADSGLARAGGDPAFDDLASAAAGLLGAPQAYFTVLDAEHCWYVGASGRDPADARAGTIDASLCREVVATELPLLVSDVRTDPRTLDDPAIVEAGVVAWAGFPVGAVSGEVLGSFCVVDVRPREWTAPEIEALRVLAQAATAQVHLRQALRAERGARADAESAWIEAEMARADQQRAQAREHELVEVFQRSLLPDVLPAVPGLSTAVAFEASNEAADMGGDWYDVIRQGADDTSFIIGDVCGHDVGAVAVMAQVRHSLHLLAVRQAHPIDALAELDGLMLEHDFDRFATVAILSWSAATSELSYVSAGHPPPLLVRADGTACYLEGGRRPPVNIGLASTVSAAPGVAVLGPGDTVIAFTDGLYEATGANLEFGLDRLRGLACKTAPGAEPDVICEVLLDGMRPVDGWQDDVALVILRRP